MKKLWPAPQRNAAPILEVLKRVLPRPGLTLEIASGSGQHAAHFCESLSELRWQPTDYDPTAIPSIDAWREDSGLENFLPALHLDVTSDAWPVEEVDSIFCANMIHISPWTSCLGLFRGASRVLRSNGVLALYGPFIEQDVETSASNMQFDASLRSRNSDWAIRDLGEVKDVATSEGLVFQERIAMPANNLCVVFKRQG